MKKELPSKEMMIDIMASIFQEALIKPVTWVDAKRGMEAVYEDLEVRYPGIFTGTYVK